MLVRLGLGHSGWVSSVLALEVSDCFDMFVSLCIWKSGFLGALCLSYRNLEPVCCFCLELVSGYMYLCACTSILLSVHLEAS